MYKKAKRRKMTDKTNEKYDDAELFDIVADVRSGNVEGFSILKKKYAPLIRSMAYSFAGQGGSSEDYEREAESALLKAAIKFDLQQNDVSFGLFAKICIRNALVSLKRKEMSKKRRLERQAVGQAGRKKRSFSMESNGDGNTEKLVDEINRVLSGYERKVFNEYMSGKTIGEMAETLGKPKKSVNNALYRIKEKVKEIKK